MKKETTTLMHHKKTEPDTRTSWVVRGTNMLMGFALMLVMTLIVMGCDSIVDQKTDADAGIATSDIAGAFSMVEGSEILCIDSDASEYHVVSDSETIEWGNRRGTSSKTVEIEYYNTLTEFVLRVKSTETIADVLVDDESIKDFDGTVEAGEWQEFTFDLDPDWQAGDSWTFEVKVDGSGPPVLFEVDYTLLGECDDDTESKFFLAENGITIQCPTATVGEKGFVGDVEYEAVDSDLLIVRRNENADLTRLCTTLVTNMSAMFTKRYSSFNQPIGGWDTGNVTNMSGMFLSNLIFNQPIGEWNTSNVTDMTSMFFQAENFNQDIGNWDTGNVTNMYTMFGSSISGINMTFNGDIGSWDTGNVTNMFAMFHNSISFNGDIGSWDTAKVTDMDRMFAGASSFNRDLSGWCVFSLITSPPADFDTGATSWTLEDSRPKWGDPCP